MNKLKSKITSPFLLISLGALLLGFLLACDTQEEELHESGLPQSEFTGEANAPQELNEENEDDLEISNVLIELPFFSQAPHRNWDYPWQEACEEASILLAANHYLDLDLNADSFNEHLLALVDWQMENFGSYEHTDIEQTQQMLEENYGLSSVIHRFDDNTPLTFDAIQNVLNKGHLIVAPFAGKVLENPHFKNGGPNYHMLLINGASGETMDIFTHDVGTRYGAYFPYSWENIQDSLHDWHDDDILLGTPSFLEILPPETTNAS